MQLYLLRHADANTEAATDDARTLSEKGEQQANRVARFCEAHGLNLSLVLTSPIRRAHDTARIVAEHLRSDVVTAPWLGADPTPETFLEELKACRSQNSVMLVGHEPDFSHFAAHLLGLADNAQIRIRKASLTLLDLDSLDPGTARLIWTLPCRFM